MSAEEVQYIFAPILNCKFSCHRIYSNKSKI